MKYPAPGTPFTMVKQVIQFSDGSFWKCYETTTFDLNEAWTFNKVSGAEQTCKTNKLTDYKIVQVYVTFNKGMTVSLESRPEVYLTSHAGELPAGVH